MRKKGSRRRHPWETLLKKLEISNAMKKLRAKRLHIQKKFFLVVQKSFKNLKKHFARSMKLQRECMWERNLCVCERERAGVRVCVCVSERERVREREAKGRKGPCQAAASADTSNPQSPDPKKVKNFAANCFSPIFWRILVFVSCDEEKQKSAPKKICCLQLKQFFISRWKEKLAKIVLWKNSGKQKFDQS